MSPPLFFESSEEEEEGEYNPDGYWEKRMERALSQVEPNINPDPNPNSEP